jgi:hypothetical protein
MSAWTLAAAVVLPIGGLSWLSTALSGAPDWGTGTFVALAVILFVSSYEKPPTKITPGQGLNMRRRHIKP